MNRQTRHSIVKLLYSMGCYGGVGAISTAAHYLLFIALLPLLPVLAASVLGSFLGAVLSFCGNSRWTFSGGQRSALQRRRFFLVAALHNAMNVVLMQSLLSADVTPMLAQLTTTLSLAAISFFIHRNWSFQDENSL